MTIPKPGDELTLRNGWPAKVLAVHPEQKAAIFGEYRKPGGQWVVDNWDKDGQWLDSENDFDLMLPEPEPKQLRGWVNVYEDGGISPILDSRDTADNWAKLGAIHRTECLYIDRTYEEGEGL